MMNHPSLLWEGLLYTSSHSYDDFLNNIPKVLLAQFHHMNCNIWGGNTLKVYSLLSDASDMSFPASQYIQEDIQQNSQLKGFIPLHLEILSADDFR